MNFRALLLVVVFLLLQSCQHTKINPYQEAASYNTQLGLAYLKQGDRVRAKRKLLTALAQAPESPHVNVAIAYFMETTGEVDKAALYYKKAIAIAPNRGETLNNYGAFLCRHARYREAQVYFIKAIHDTQYEHTAGAYENAGLCAAAIPDDKKAVYYFKKALAHDPSRKQSLNELVRIEIKRGHKRQAQAFLRHYSAHTLADDRLHRS